MNVPVVIKTPFSISVVQGTTEITDVSRRNTSRIPFALECNIKAKNSIDTEFSRSVNSTISGFFCYANLREPHSRNSNIANRSNAYGFILCNTSARDLLHGSNSSGTASLSLVGSPSAKIFSTSVLLFPASLVFLDMLCYSASGNDDLSANSGVIIHTPRLLFAIAP